MGAGHFNQLCMSEKFKRKKILRSCLSRKFPGAKGAIIWKNPAVVLPLPLLFWPEWDLLVCRAM